MFKFNELKSIHLEITSNCQASCPMCARNYHGGKENPYLKVSSWSLDNFKSVFSKDVIDQIEGFYFCGNFGDPILNNDFLDMIKWIVPLKPSMAINIHTNGGARKTEWWKELARSLPKNHTVMFGIDGLEDTHHLYRIGTTYDNVIKNAKAFIDAGGNAEWVFLKFRHNEHQEEEARHRAKELGFKTFMLKNSSRFLGEPKHKVVDKQGNVLYHIEPPSDNKMHFVSKHIINNYKSVIKNSTIKCKALELREIYIDANMHVFPCCWLASIPYTQYDPENVNVGLSLEIKKQYKSLVEDLKGIENLNAATVGIKNILESSEWQNVWNKYWYEEKLIMCARICGTSNEISKPHDQFLERADLKI